MDSPRRAWVRVDGGIRSVEVRPLPRNGAGTPEGKPIWLADFHGASHVNGSAPRRAVLACVDTDSSKQAWKGSAGDVEGGQRDGWRATGHIAGAPLWVRMLCPRATAAVGAHPAVPAGTGQAESTGPEAWRGPRLRAWVRGAAVPRADLWVQLAVLVAVAFVSATNMRHWPAALFDEGTYVGNAWAVQHRGALAFYTYTYGHPPLAWLLVSLWTWANGVLGHTAYSLDEARTLMFINTMVSCSLLYTLARRLDLGRAFAAGAVLLFTLSPVSLFFHRAVLLDNVATVWALAAFVLALSPQRRLWSMAASGACFAASVLSKETTLVLLPALLLAVLQNCEGQTRRYCLTLFVSSLGLIGLVFPLYAALKGELLPGPGHVSLIGTDLDMLFGRRTSGNVLDPRSLAHGTVSFWLWLDPWLLWTALALSPVALLARKMRPIALAFLIQVVMILRPGYLPAMYVIALLPFAALIVAGTTQWFWRAARGRLIGRRIRFLRPAAVVLGTLLLGCEAAAAALWVAPRWERTDRAALTVRLDGAERAAQQWLVRHATHDKRLIVTDDFWLYLIEHGFDSHPVKGGFNSRTVVSYWPLDKDPAVRRYFPRSWREFDYVVSTEAMRDTAIYTPSTAQALEHSHVVIKFGRGAQRVEIRAIDAGARAAWPPVNHSG